MEYGSEIVLVGDLLVTSQPTIEQKPDQTDRKSVV